MPLGLRSRSCWRGMTVVHCRAEKSLWCCTGGTFQKSACWEAGESCSLSAAGLCAPQEPGPGEAVSASRSRSILLATKLPEGEFWRERKAADHWVLLTTMHGRNQALEELWALQESDSRKSHAEGTCQANTQESGRKPLFLLQYLSSTLYWESFSASCQRKNS